MATPTFLRICHQCTLTHEAQHQNAGRSAIKTFHSAPQPNCQVNADATKGHAFGILMALGCALRPHGLRRRLPW
jgi:hypothetical protein